MNKTVVLGLMIALSLTRVASAEEIRPAETHFFHETFGDLAEELGTARQEGKFGLMIMFEANDCPWCERMMKNVMNRASVQDYYREHFQIILVNVDGDTTVTDFDGAQTPEKDFALERHRVRATPTFLFFDLDGRLATRYTGTTRSVDEFLWLGEYVADGHFREEKFIHFKKRKRQSG